MATTSGVTARGLTSGQRCTRAVLLVLGIAVMGLAAATEHMPLENRVLLVGFAFLFLHTASNRPAIVEPRLSFRKSVMSPLSRFLLALSEATLVLSVGYVVVSRLAMWLA